jgi:hypothetical protein
MDAMRTILLPRRACLPAALVTIAAVAGCGSSGGAGTGGAGATSSTTSGTTSSTTTGTGAGGSVTEITCTGQPAALSLTGTWAAVGELAVSLEGAPGGAITICPANQVGQTTVILLLQVTQEGTNTLSSIQATLCSIELPVVTALVGTCDPTSQALVSTQIIAPQTLIDALPGVVPPAVTGSLMGTAPGSGVTFEPLDVTVGSAAGSALPSWNVGSSACNASQLGGTNQCDANCVSSCSTLSDSDHDGFPGVTVDVCGYTPSDTMSGVKCNAAMPSDSGATLQGQGFIDLEVNPQLTGTAKSSCEITGTVSSEVVYNLVGGNIYLAGAPITVTSAIESLPSFQVDASSSKFRMVRIDGQYGAPNWMVDPTTPSAACQVLIQKMNEL